MLESILNPSIRRNDLISLLREMNDIPYFIMAYDLPYKGLCQKLTWKCLVMNTGSKSLDGDVNFEKTADLILATISKNN